ncbi:hypothetical protein GK047_10680 [Paenibacillus sp. SYP-B3998]|uniref:Uncharacterized protein n=1 Tax=Paenibacillus sp. SYP-B3998 TaxID=2678564 RepID=A0A6G3ZWI7_9BACL|nr:hypothetical protein [Paenibacillus sp. SYP-B3998]NEW06475.1 hypothetical protein [Paenibacillus sp. SYP-B3998]
MDFTSQDVVIIERALRTAMLHEKEEQKTRDYREVLLKLQESAKHALNVHTKTATADHDGIRYDYDDSSDLM